MKVFEKITPTQLIFCLHDLIIQQFAVKGLVNRAEHAQRHREVGCFQLRQQERQRRTGGTGSGLVVDKNFRPVTFIDIDDFSSSDPLAPPRSEIALSLFFPNIIGSPCCR